MKTKHTPRDTTYQQHLDQVASQELEAEKLWYAGIKEVDND